MKVKTLLKGISDFLYPPAGMITEDLQRFDMDVDDKFFGRMDNAAAAGMIKGPCGDSMEFYLEIKDGVIKDVKYYTDGCENTRAAGYAIARRAVGRKIIDAMMINPGEIIKSGECLSEEGEHCAILAVSTLYRAIADYLLQPQK
jgi:nitrogen fixation NifU-like protein